MNRLLSVCLKCAKLEIAQGGLGSGRDTQKRRS
jgi:hypothetical protein